MFNLGIPIPGRTYVRHEPKGVVGVISPWNYPFQLAVIPAATALAGGNRVLIKPSEFTPRTADLLARLFADVYGEDEVAVVTGGPEIGKTFSELPFDHLFFTGSTRIGKIVAKAAAEASGLPLYRYLGEFDTVLVLAIRARREAGYAQP